MLVPNTKPLPKENPSYLMHSVFAVCHITHSCTFGNYYFLRKPHFDTGTNFGIIIMDQKKKIKAFNVRKHISKCERLYFFFCVSSLQHTHRRAHTHANMQSFKKGNMHTMSARLRKLLIPADGVYNSSIGIIMMAL